MDYAHAKLAAIRRPVIPDGEYAWAWAGPRSALKREDHHDATTRWAYLQRAWQERSFALRADGSLEFIAD